MAWISVHEEVIGQKLRTLSKEIGCSQNEALGILVRLWLWGIRNATADGEIINAERDDIEVAMTSGKSKGLNASDIVDALIETGWLDAVGEKYYLHDWEYWQAQWYKAMETRKRHNEAQKRYYESKRVVEPDKKEEPEKKPEKKNANDYSDEFEEFWKVYPRKKEKPKAFKQYKARLKDGYTHEQIMDATRAYEQEVRIARVADTYIKHPATFLGANLPFADYFQKSELIAQVDEDYDPYSDWR